MAAGEDRWIEEWAEDLGDLSGENIKGGLAALPERTMERVKAGQDDWPPTAQEFRALCLLSVKPAAHRAAVFLSAPLERTPLSAASLEAVRRVLAGVAMPTKTDKRIETFWSRPGSQVACNKLLDWAKSGDKRGLQHMREAIEGGYMDDNGKWQGVR